MSSTTANKDQKAGGLLLLGAIIALLAANLPKTREAYEATIHFGTNIVLFHHEIGLRFLINEVLMCVFFFCIGLELKYNLINGELKSKKVASMPFIGAVGGMLIPALIYLFFNRFDNYQRGWAIPTATDIAFAVGILSLVKHKVPKSAKSFLLALAIFDDLGAIIIIALFYSNKLNLIGCAFAMIISGVLYLLNQNHVMKIRQYIAYGCLLWVALFVAGIHTTIGGVITAIAIPMNTTKSGGPTYGHKNNIHELNEYITPFNSFIILPLFAFFNAGTHIISSYGLFHPIGAGILLGLVVGKPLGIVSFCFMADKLGLAQLPEKTNWHHIIGISMLCGIGFTMSLFIGKLAFYSTQPMLMNVVKRSVLLGSVLSGLGGLWYLSRLEKRRQSLPTTKTRKAK